MEGDLVERLDSLARMGLHQTQSFTEEEAGKLNEFNGLVSNRIEYQAAREIERLRAALAVMSRDSPDSIGAQDLFDGDDVALCKSIHALLDLGVSEALLPHRIGGHVPTLLATAALRLDDSSAGI
jgi:hypothetical protein